MPNQISNVNFQDPYQAESAGIAKRRALAEAMQQQSMQQDPTQSINGWAVRQPPGYGKIAQALAGALGQRQADTDQTAMQGRRQSAIADTMMQAQQAAQGTPGHPSPADELGGGPAKPGIAPDRQAMARILMQNQATQQIGMAEMLKAPQEPQRVDLGDKIGFVNAQGQLVRSIPKGATPDATMHEAGSDRRHAAPSGGNLLSAQTAWQNHLTPSGGAKLADERARSEGALGRGVTMRGQDMSSATAAAGQEARAAPNRPLSATAQKELFEADDVANSAKNAIDILQSILAKDSKTAKSQNDLAYEGGTASARRTGMSFVPGNYESENATVDLTNKVTGQALESLRSIFGGMPTEGERKILIELQGSVNQKAPQREAIFKRAIDLAQKRMAFAQDKGKRLREGTYFGSGVATNQDDATPYDGPERRTGGDDPLGLRK